MRYQHPKIPWFVIIVPSKTVSLWFTPVLETQVIISRHLRFQNSRFRSKHCHQQVGYEYEEEIVYHPGRSWQRACDVSCLKAMCCQRVPWWQQWSTRPVEKPLSDQAHNSMEYIYCALQSIVFSGGISWQKDISWSFHWGFAFWIMCWIFSNPCWMLDGHHFWRAPGAMWLWGAHCK